jgi:hypothetical protein
MPNETSQPSIARPAAVHAASEKACGSPMWWSLGQTSITAFAGKRSAARAIAAAVLRAIGSTMISAPLAATNCAST